MSNLISRQAVIDRINKLIEVEKKQGTDDWGYGRERVNAYDAMLHMVKSEYLYPSVEPERKTGKQPESGRLIKYSVHGHDACKCSRCNTDLGYPYEGKFCKWCGAKMEVN